MPEMGGSRSVYGRYMPSSTTSGTGCVPGRNVGHLVELGQQDRLLPDCDCDAGGLGVDDELRDQRVPGPDGVFSAEHCLAGGFGGFGSRESTRPGNRLRLRRRPGRRRCHRVAILEVPDINSTGAARPGTRHPQAFAV